MQDFAEKITVRFLGKATFSGKATQVIDYSIDKYMDMKNPQRGLGV